MIKIKKGAVLDDNQKKVLARIEKVCGNNILTVTRGHSSPQDQMDIIEYYGRKKDCLFPEFLLTGPVDVKINITPIGLVYHWQRTWSKLLHLGVVINPPLPAICLDEYTRPSGEKMQGKEIFGSAHITGQRNGCWPIDFSAKVNGAVNFAKACSILERALLAGAGIKHVKAEHGNGCVHVDTVKVD